MKRKLISLVILACLLLSGGIAMLSGRQQNSASERRPLAQWPSLTWNSIVSRSFMESAEKAAADQFPMRDIFRSCKALFLYGVLGQLDNNGIYVSKGSASKLDYPLRESSVKNAIATMTEIENTYLAGTDVHCYYSVIPDKNYFMAAPLGYPVMDYQALIAQMNQALSMRYIDLFPSLDLSCYYLTDPHWRQEALLPVAQTLAEAMDATWTPDFTSLKLGSFSGAYTGQSALPLKADPLYIMESNTLAACTATDMVTGKNIPIYDRSKVESRDPYELFLGGSVALQVLENPAADTDRELIVFRDSFASSLIPLLAGCYRKITLVDLRYVHRSQLQSYLTFTNQDVLFLYSTLILNNSESLN